MKLLIKNRETGEALYLPTSEEWLMQQCVMLTGGGYSEAQKQHAQSLYDQISVIGKATLGKSLIEVV